MAFFQNKNDSKKCSSCGGTSYNLTEPNRRVAFGLQEMEPKDIAEGFVTPIPDVWLAAFVYQCEKCNHIDFFGLPVFQPISE